MSATIDSSLPAEFRAELLKEVRDYLPAFLRRDASEQHDPLGDVKELLNLEDQDLKRVLAVHGCLDSSVLAFGNKLREGVRSPMTASSRPAEIGQAVRGPVDWTATVARRSLEAGNATRYVVRAAQRAYDIPENRVLAWVLDRLHVACRRALKEKVDAEVVPEDSKAYTWAERIERLAAQIDLARRTEWLRGIEPEPPRGRTMQRLRGARNSFYREDVVAAAQKMLMVESPDERDLIDVLNKRFFEPAATWMIFEVCVALRLAREFGQASGRPRRSRLLFGSGRAAYARYALPDDTEVELLYQVWPDKCGPSLLSAAGERHGLGVGSSRPDLFVVRRGDVADVLLLELKASRSPKYLKQGLIRLLGYLAERPAFWKRKPAGWLVAPASAAFISCPLREDDELWIVSADEVSAAAVARFSPSAGPFNRSTS